MGTELERLSPALKKFFFEVIEAFDQKKLPYMLIGAAACFFYGLTRETHDLDFAIRGPLDFLRAVKIIRGLGFPTLKHDEDFLDFGSDENLRKAARAMMMDREVFSSAEGWPLSFWNDGLKVGLDLFLFMENFYWEAFRRKRNFDGIWVASLEDLIIQKIVCGRPVDLLDVRMLASVNRLKLSYIEKWLRKLGKASFDEMVLGSGDIVLLGEDGASKELSF